MNFRNAQFTVSGTVDCEIEHPKYGWIPFTASPDDAEPLGKQIFAAAKASAAPYTGPSAEQIAAEARAEEVRLARNAALRESDTEILRLYLAENLPVPQAWREYRQALRDVPQQGGFPNSVNWPGRPEK